ncbi:glycosyltransferase [Phormidium sp. CCY1219]|uniref:glycosyltransferase n=1 Tax=Phormidium sp. CCY1219 TaxID=2886104 RepID=UPI002D1E8F9B|nr:glycosyltransferase [Phormidium sp. CCY1219]MEB3830726.1 glycosyltransferase [Phormidium sp. CCY1219]
MQENQPLVSIGMPVYNGDRYLRQALDSLLAQDYACFELIISDNASTDNTPEICQEYAGKDSRIQYYRNSDNIGSTNNFNKVFELSNGKYFMWAAHDDFWERKFIGKCVEGLENNPKAVLCCSEVVFIDEKGSVKTDWTSHPQKKNVATVGMNLVQRSHQLIAKAGWYTIYSLIRRGALLKTNLLLDKYGADVIILQELNLLGEFAKIDEPLFFYRLHESQGSLEEVKQAKLKRQKPYSGLVKDLLDVVLKSNQVDEYVKEQVRADFIETLAFQNSELFNLIAAEQKLDLRKEISPDDLRYFIYKILEKGDLNANKQSPDRAESNPKEPLPKKALVAYQNYVYPPRYASDRRCLLVINGLKELGYEVTLFSSNLFTNIAWTEENIPQLEREVGIKVDIHQVSQGDRQFVEEEFRKTGGRQWWNMYSPGLREHFRQLFHRLQPDIVVINYAFWGELAIADEFKSALRIIDTLDLLSLNQKMAGLVSSFLARRQIDGEFLDENFFNKRGLSVDEKEYKIYDSYDCTIAITPQEQKLIEEHTSQTQVIHIPFTFEVKDTENTYRGNPVFAIGPNAFNYQAYIYFVAKVLPRVLAEVPEFVLNVIGDGGKFLSPTRGTQLLGFVPDLEKFYQESRFAICPMLGGTGQQLKVLEAMAHGLPVVVLENVAQRCPIQHGIDGFVAKNAEEFAKYTIELFRNPQLCRQLGEAARKTIADKFSNQLLLERLEEMTDRAPMKTANKPVKVIVDGIFYQINQTGIARVWHALLQEWVKTGFAKQILFLDRVGTAPRIPGIKYLCIPAYDYNNTDSDRAMLQSICDEENADIFISTYYTTPLSTPSVFMAYDMIPELSRANLCDPMWREKQYGIRHACAYITISKNTARDLVRFWPQIPPDCITVAHCGISSYFSPATPEEIQQFKSKYSISKPYFLLVGSRGNLNHYKNALLFFKSLAEVPNCNTFEIVCVGGKAELEPEFQVYARETNVRVIPLHDEELRIAYSGAIALIYPSKYEGFGLPLLEAMACGCPAITCPNGAIPEVAGQAVIYVKDNDTAAMANALLQIQKPEIRNTLIAAGFERVKQFSWQKMADRVSSVLIEKARQPAKFAIASTAPSAIEQSHPKPSAQSAVSNPRQTRQQLARQWLNLPAESLDIAYCGTLGQTHKALLESNIKDEPLNPDERAFVREIAANLARGFQHPNAIQSFLAGMLYCYPHQLNLNYENAPIPRWLADDYIKFMFSFPNIFHEKGEAENYCQYLQDWLRYVHTKLFSNPQSPVWRKVAEFFTDNPTFRNPYFNAANLKELYVQWADIVEFTLKNRGYALDYRFRDRPASRQKIRIGILRDHFSPATETFATLPVFEALDVQQFEIILYATWTNNNSLERYCQSCSARFVELPENLSQQVQQIREDDLDILFIGTNITYTNKPLTHLVMHRLARVQVTSIASPITTGIRNIDGYIAGTLTAPAATAQSQYREQLINIEGSGLCFRFPTTQPAPTVNPTRASWGATDYTVVFISGANFYKIIPELSETWAKIIAACPNSILVLYPFGPAWNNTYPAEAFLERLRTTFTQYHIDPKRLVLINTLPSPTDIKKCVQLADIYLDSYPYSGATSLLDPLGCGIPAIAWEGDTLRSRQGCALLRELQLPDLITDSEQAYINLAITLARNPQLRQHYRQQIQQQMQNNPPFLDSASYGAKIGQVFAQLFRDWQNQPHPSVTPGSSLSDSGLTAEFLNRLIGCANLYYIDPTDASVLAELREIRQEFAEFWLSVPPEKIQPFYASDVGKAHESVMKSGVQNEPLTDTERQLVAELTAEIGRGLDAPKAINSLLAILLYRHREQLSLPENSLPAWLKIPAVNPA